MEAVKVDARDNVPRTDDSAGPLIFFLVLVFFAVGAVAWHYFSRLIAPAPPPATVIPTDTELIQAPATTLPLSVPSAAVVTSYGYDDSGRYLVPLQSTASADPVATLKAQLNALDPAPGIERLLPGQTQLRDLRREGSLALCDLPSELFELLPGEGAAHGLLEALTHAITGLEGVTKVQFLIDGQVEDTTDGGIALGEPWTVRNPLNVLDGGRPGTTSGTFYFFDDTGRWLVPVTLAYSPGAAPLRSRLNRLMEGPPAGSDLKSVIPAQLSLESVEYDNATSILGLAWTTTEPPQSWGLFDPPHMMQAILQTLSEATPIRSVWMTINGQDVWTVESFAQHKSAISQYQLINPVSPPATP